MCLPKVHDPNNGREGQDHCRETNDVLVLEARSKERCSDGGNERIEAVFTLVGAEGVCSLFQGASGYGSRSDRGARQGTARFNRMQSTFKGRKLAAHAQIVH